MTRLKHGFGDKLRRDDLWKILRIEEYKREIFLKY